MLLRQTESPSQTSVNLRFPHDLPLYEVMIFRGPEQHDSERNEQLHKNESPPL